jgi:tetratricopeptide (TPR) repeat protein
MNAPISVDAARALYADGGSSHDFEHVLRVTRDNVMILDNYGNALQDVGRYAEAARAHTEAVRVDPGHCNSKYNLGNALYRLRRYREALDAYERSLACYLREGRQGAYLVDTYANLGNTNLTLNRPAEAERHYRALLHIDPNNSWGHAALRDAIARQRGAGQRRATPPR